MQPLWHRWIPAAVAVLIIAIAGILLALQGWKSRLPTFDLLPHIHDAQAFIASGRIPQSGTVTSLGSYTPPGTTWLIIPGRYLFDDPRLVESIGGALLYVGTLIGIFFVARVYFGVGSALVAVSLWGLSELGLFFAYTLWPRGHPFFYIWMVYWIVQWVETKHAGYLAAAVMTWALGMYVFLEIAPAILILPVVWFLYRPPIRLRPLVLAGILIGLVWYPYLRFEMDRGFVDIASQLLRQKIRPVNFKDAWCDPTLAPASWEALGPGVDQVVASAGSAVWMHAWGEKAYRILDLLLHGNFDSSPFLKNSYNFKFPGANIVLLLLVLAGLLLLSARSFRRGGGELFEVQGKWRLALKYLAVGAIVAGIAGNEFIIARYFSLDGALEPATKSLVRGVQGLLVLIGIALLTMRHAIVAGLHRLSLAFRLEGENEERNPTLIAVCLLVPWLTLLLMTEPGRIDRFWWLWPIQIIVLTSIITNLVPQLRLRRPWVWLAVVIPVTLIVGNNFVLSQVTAWTRDGWQGMDADQIRAIDYIAGELRRENKGKAAIGYDLKIYPFMVMDNVLDRRYKAGADLDLVLKYRHGVVNDDQCPEGISPSDQYRVVQLDSTGPAPSPGERIPLRADEKFYPSQRFGMYQVLLHR
jgi:hypothetical protein